MHEVPIAPLRSLTTLCLCDHAWQIPQHSFTMLLHQRDSRTGLEEPLFPPNPPSEGFVLDIVRIRLSDSLQWGVQDMDAACMDS